MANPQRSSFFSSKTFLQTVTAVPVQIAHGRTEQRGGGRNPQIHRQGPSGHAAGERRDFARVREEIADEGQVAKVGEMATPGSNELRGRRSVA